MTETFKARIETTNGHQVIILPPEIHLDGDEVAVQHDEATGQVTIKRDIPHPYWQALFAELDALPVSDADLDEYLVDRPLNFPIGI